MRGRGGRGGQGGGPGADAAAAAAPTNDVQDKTKALSDALDNKDSDPKDIAQKLAGLRDARVKAKAELVKAQEDLKALLTSRQEAMLVMRGMLD
jgi:Spy/CpxP family protein refolding chaperone